MPNLPILIPAIGASAAFAAALDAKLAAGAVEWLIDICLSDPDTPMTAAAMPMEHSQHVPLYAGIGCGLTSVAFFAAWWQGEATDGSCQSSTREGELALIASLACLANATGGCAPEDIMAVHARVAPGDLGCEQATIALEYFTPATLVDDLDLFSDLDNPEDRRMVICGAIELARRFPGRETLDDTLFAIAGAMQMSGSEIEEHWNAHLRDTSPEANSPTSVGRLRTASGRLREIAADAARRYTPHPPVAGPVS